MTPGKRLKPTPEAQRIYGPGIGNATVIRVPDEYTVIVRIDGETEPKLFGQSVWQT